MISFENNKCLFQYRSAAIIRLEDHILIHRAEEDDFWALPGGRVEFMEFSDLAITREILEELGMESRVESHLWHVESFFEYNSRKYHELSNYYLVKLVNPLAIEPEVDFKGIEDTDNLIFRWVPLAKVSCYELKPVFLMNKLNDLPSNTEYLQIDERHA